MCHIRLKKYLYKTMQYVHAHSINILGNDKKKDREFGRETMFGSLWKLPENVFGRVELSEERNISWVAVRALLNVHTAIFIGKESRVEIVKTTKLREIPLTNFPKWSLNSLKVHNVIERHILIRVSQFYFNVCSALLGDVHIRIDSEGTNMCIWLLTISWYISCINNEVPNRYGIWMLRLF